ncbi:MAG: pilus assembly protein PilP [Desulfobacterales bacterium]
MHKYLIKFIVAVCFAFLFSSINGCGDKTSPPTKPAAVSKKVVAKKIETAPADAPVTVNVPAKQGTEVKEIKTDISTAKTGSVAEKPAVSIQPPVVTDKGKQGEAVKTEEGKKDSAAPDPATEIAKVQSDTLPVYDPHGRIDPFIPLFKDEGPLAGAEKESKGRIPRTPLEMIDLGQLKLVAVLQTSRGNKALVEEASGKGYIVEKGTYLGVNSGRVVKILKDRVIIEEKVESIVGKSTIQERELKLQKPLGEE